MKVKFFSARYLYMLEDEVNEFIKGKKVINISMTTEAKHFESYTCVILYEE